MNISRPILKKNKLEKNLNFFTKIIRMRFLYTRKPSFLSVTSPNTISRKIMEDYGFF